MYDNWMDFFSICLDEKMHKKWVGAPVSIAKCIRPFARAAKIKKYLAADGRNAKLGDQQVELKLVPLA
ncbi:MAG TPA: hypothetical protein VIZ65_12500 [Cellvibrionaceae bacterium]